MHQDISNVFNIPWILQELLSRKSVFGGKVFLIFPIIYQIADQNLALWSLLTGAWMPDLSSFNWFGHYPLSLLLDFREIRRILASSTSPTLKLLKIYIYLIWSCLNLVFLMTVHEAHKEYISLIDQIQAKYELLDSGECGSVGTPAFNAECSKLAHLMARMSKLCKHLNLPMPKELHRPPHFKHWSALNSKLFVCGRFS